MVTQRELARAAGLSQTAVSLALRNSSTVSRATIRRVQQVARRLGYRPDPMISALMSRRQSRTTTRLRAKIAFITAFPERDEWRRSQYAAGCYAGVQAACSARGYLAEPIWLWEPLIHGRRLSQILWTQNVQGVVIAPLPVDNPPIALEWERFAAVSLDYSMADPVLHRVVDDHAFGMERVLDETARRDYRRPGLVIRASQDVRTHHSRLGVFLVQRRLHPEWDEIQPLILPEDRWDAGLFAAWLKRERPDVVLTEETAVMKAVSAIGLRIPRDLGIAFFHKEQPARQLSGLHVNSHEVGSIAAGILMRLVETNERGSPRVPTTTLVNSFLWHPGRTLRRQAGAPP
jgi:LacI family transcriptional regulator